LQILCVIDHFGSGGAQRQMVELACGLKDRGHEVQIFVYYPEFEFFKSRISLSSIPVASVDKRSCTSWGVVFALWSLMRARRFDVVVAYLSTPSIYVELLGLFARNSKIIVSERSSYHYDESRAFSFLSRCLHGLADHIVVNSESHASWLRTRFPWLAKKVSCIYNGLELTRFAVAPRFPSEQRDLKLLAIGRVTQGKNPLTLVRACVAFQRKHGWAPLVSWVGRTDETPAERSYAADVNRLLDEHPPIKERWAWLGEQRDIPSLLADHHAVIHPSFYEGLPNVICESLAAGRPVLISDVCDHSLLVKNGERGFLFDPHDPNTIVTALERITGMTSDDWIRMSTNARAYAESMLTTERMVRQYEQLFKRVLN
jgi:glycosyltransferase involved in cell wall biosynthesis